MSNKPCPSKECGHRGDHYHRQVRRSNTGVTWVGEVFHLWPSSASYSGWVASLVYRTYSHNPGTAARLVMQNFGLPSVHDVNGSVALAAEAGKDD